MRKFKVGDRVECIDGYDDPAGPLTGWRGTVRAMFGSDIYVTWDGRGVRRSSEDRCIDSRLELIKPAPDLEARVAALEKLVGMTKATEYSFGDRVEVLHEGEWVEGLIAAPKDSDGGKRWCEYLDDTSMDGASGAWFEHDHIRPRQ